MRKDDTSLYQPYDGLLPMHKLTPCMSETRTYEECDRPDMCHIVEIPKRHPFYPSYLEQLLGLDAPHKLYCYGNLGIMEDRQSVMICGARKASQTALELAYACACLFAEAGVVVSSGFARGVDMAAHTGALAASGDTTAYLPYGLARLKIPVQLMRMYAPEHFLAVTELKSHYVFTTKNALRRNTLMAAAADAIIVIEPGETGGSWYSAMKAASMGKPLFFMEGERTECIDRLEEYSARRIPCDDGAPDLSEVFESIEAAF